MFTIEKKGNTIYLFDKESGNLIAMSPSRLIFFDVGRFIIDQTIAITNINAAEQTHLNWPAIAMGKAFNSGGQAFTDATWLTFAEVELG